MKGNLIKSTRNDNTNEQFQVERKIKKILVIISVVDCVGVYRDNILDEEIFLHERKRKKLVNNLDLIFFLSFSSILDAEYFTLRHVDPGDIRLDFF